MSKEYIERETLLAWLENLNCSRYLINSIEDKNRFPAADVAPVRHGEWIPHEIEQTVDNYTNPHWAIEYFKPVSYYCSLCGRIEEHQEPYCNCGARMDGKDWPKIEGANNRSI